MITQGEFDPINLLPKSGSVFSVITQGEFDPINHRIVTIMTTLCNTASHLLSTFQLNEFHPLDPLPKSGSVFSVIASIMTMLCNTASHLLSTFQLNEFHPLDPLPKSGSVFSVIASIMTTLCNTASHTLSYISWSRPCYRS